MSWKRPQQFLPTRKWPFSQAVGKLWTYP